jgi:hypothetical protein
VNYVTITSFCVTNANFKKSYLPVGLNKKYMIERIEKLIKDVKNVILDLFPRKVSVLPLQLTRVTEKFDSVTRPPFSCGIGDRIKH